MRVEEITMSYTKISFFLFILQIGFTQMSLGDSDIISKCKGNACANIIDSANDWGIGFNYNYWLGNLANKPKLRNKQLDLGARFYITSYAIQENDHATCSYSIEVSFIDKKDQKAVYRSGVDIERQGDQLKKILRQHHFYKPGVINIKAIDKDLLQDKIIYDLNFSINLTSGLITGNFGQDDYTLPDGIKEIEYVAINTNSCWVPDDVTMDYTKTFMNSITSTIAANLK